MQAERSKSLWKVKTFVTLEWRQFLKIPFLKISVNHSTASCSIWGTLQVVDWHQFCSVDDGNLTIITISLGSGILSYFNENEISYRASTCELSHSLLSYVEKKTQQYPSTNNNALKWRHISFHCTHILNKVTMN